MKHFSLNQKLAALALAISLAALLLGFVSPNGINKANEAPNYISVVSLAQKIKDREPINLIDLRSKKMYDQFHIPTAEHLPLSDLLDRSEFPEGQLVFYSGDDPLSRHLWSELPDAIKLRSLIVYGGVYDWYERLLYPELPMKVDQKDSVVYRQVHDLSLFYGGQAEFVEEKDVMDYYLQDFSKASWPRYYRQNGLMRKGC